MALATVLLGFAGCGDDEEADGHVARFEEEFGAISKTFGRRAERVTETTDASSPSGLQLLALRQSGIAEDYLERLRGAEPPEDIDAEFDGYVDAIEDLSRGYEEIAGATPRRVRKLFRARNFSLLEPESVDAVARFAVKARVLGYEFGPELPGLTSE